MNIFYSIMKVVYLLGGIFLLAYILDLITSISNKFNEESKFIELQKIKEEMKPVNKLLLIYFNH